MKYIYKSQPYKLNKPHLTSSKIMHFFSFFMTSSTSLRNSWSTSVTAVADVGVAYDEVIGGEESTSTSRTTSLALRGVQPLATQPSVKRNQHAFAFKGQCLRQGLLYGWFSLHMLRLSALFAIISGKGTRSWYGGDWRVMTLIPIWVLWCSLL